MDNLWQSPYVNVFKHLNVAQWKKASKEGDVVSLMDKVVKGTVYKIAGSIPAGNFIQLPKANGQSLGLTGRFLYILFKTASSKHFVVHMDLVTSDNLVIRVSFSNLFKEFKSTSTWLQFPFVCARVGSLPSFIAEAERDQSGPTPMLTRWSIICLDLQHILSMYLNRKFLYLKSMKLCANMAVKNIFTSCNLYDPDLTMAEAKRKGLMAQGICPLPRDMSFPLGKGENWHDSYDWIRFPQESTNKPFDSIQAPNPLSSSKPSAASKATDLGPMPRRIQPKTVDVSKCVADRVAMIHKLTSPPKPPSKLLVTKEVPAVADLSGDQDDVHIYAHMAQEGVKKSNKTLSKGKGKVLRDLFPGGQSIQDYTSLEPDPIMKLKRIIGFGGASYRDVLWSSDGSSVIYPCHAVVVSMKIATGQQKFFIGHTEKVSCLALSGNSSLLASGQTSQMATVRVWKYSTGECLAIGKAHVHSLTCLSFSAKGSVLCGVGKDNHGKNLVVAWNTSKVSKQREMPVLAKAHTDVDIARLVIAPFDETKLVSCGIDNLRLWRIKEGSLRSAPVNLGEYNAMDFTDVCFESCSHFDVEPESKLFYACSKSGHIFEVEYNSLAVHHVRRLLPTKSKVTRPGQRANNEDADARSLCINSLHLNDTFCVTGSDDGYLRLWPLDFAHVYLEAEHEGPVTVAKLSSDGLKIVAGTSTGNLGVLDVSSRGYTTLMRSHTDRIESFALDQRRGHLATVSSDSSIRVWDTETLQQLYDFSAPEELPCTINYHPTKQVFACGFHSGAVRIFNVESTSLMAEHRELRGQVTGLVYSPDGSRLFACCSMGVAAVFDSSLPSSPAVRVVAGLVARGEKYGPQAIAISPCGRRTAFVGPTELTVTVADAKCLDELLRIDISKMSVGVVTPTANDAAIRLAFSSSQIGHLIVTTADNRLVKYDSRNGRLLYEMEHIHRKGCSTIAVSDCGRFMATGGDKTIKVWDYSMSLDINFQVFIGHSENVSRLRFTPDGLGLLSAGEAVYMWDFLARRPPTPPVEGRMIVQDLESMRLQDLPGGEGHLNGNFHRKISPRSDDIDGLSSIHSDHEIDDVPDLGKRKTFQESQHVNDPFEKKALCLSKKVSKDRDNAALRESAKSSVDVTHLSNSSSKSHQHEFVSGADGNKRHTKVAVTSLDRVGGGDGPPSVFSCYRQREKMFCIAQRRYTAPPNQAGLKLKSVIGYNCNGRGNMVWHPDSGFFAYTSGCIIVVEDLTNGQQKYLQGHTEEISTLALQNDGLVLASASPSFQLIPCQVCVWDTETSTCKKVLLRHKFAVQCMQFSRDDRFLITVGDYRENEIVVWSTDSYDVMASSFTASSIFDLKWDPYTVNEFASVGDDGTILFWLLDETSSEVCLNVHQAGLPTELETKTGQANLAFTCMAYAGGNTMFIGTHSGTVSAWDTRNNSCFLHWEAHSGEITFLVARHSRLMSASKSGSLKLWAVGALAGSAPKHQTDLTMEDEIKVDGAITSAAFDDTLDMGIVGTASGVLWYVNWTERSSIRLVSGHQNKINDVTFLSGHLVTGGDDGSVRVWALNNREQVLQFQVRDQSCTSLAAILTPKGDDSSQSQWVVGGYSDGTVRLFDVGSVSMMLKLQPHPVTVTALAVSADGQMILSGASDGIIAISSPTTGMTVRVISDHQGVAISNFDVTVAKEQVDLGVTAPILWLASSLDRRVSVWSADWSSDFCELVDWLSFPAPAVMPDGSRIKKNDTAHFHQLPPSLALFSPSEPDTVVYTGYGMDKCIHFYSLTQRKVVRTVDLNHWSLSMDVSPDSSFIAVGIPDRLIKLVDYTEGSFQDYTGHSDAVTTVKFSPSGTSLLTVSHNEMLVWEVMV